MEFTRKIDVSLAHDKAVAAIKDALQDQGFGILTEIDTRQTLADKLDVEIADHVILGACNPGLAHRATQADPRIATLLPCNVVVRAEDDHTVIEALDPTLMAEMSGRDGLAEIADEAARGIQAALDAVKAGADAG